MNARLSPCPAIPGSTSGRWPLGSGGRYVFSEGPDVMIGAVAVGAVVPSIEATLDMETGLVWRLSFWAASGIDIAICAIASLALEEALFALLWPCRMRLFNAP